MLSLHRVLLVLAAAMAFQSATALGQEIDIKGLRLGMARAEVEEKFGSLPLKDFTIAGVQSRYPIGPPRLLAFYEDRLDSFTFAFDADQFEDVRGAVKQKYPALKCESIPVTNAMGALFTDVHCSLGDERGLLELTKFIDLRTSALTLRSYRKLKEISDKNKEKQNDL